MVKNSGNIALQITLLYLFWFVSCAVAFLNFVVALNTTRSLAVLAGADQWTLPAVHRFAAVILAIILVIFFFWSETHYRKSSKHGVRRLLRAFGWVTGAQALLLLVAYLLPTL